MTEPYTAPTLRAPHPALRKVPEATALSWAIKICTTGMGESASDFMGSRPVLLAGPLVALEAHRTEGVPLATIGAAR